MDGGRAATAAAAPSGFQPRMDSNRQPVPSTRRAPDAGNGGSWEKVDEGLFLLRPRSERPRAVLCFVGGALVGAAPQLTYGRFLRRLVQRGCAVLAASYSAAFDYDAVADLLELRFARGLGLLPDGLGELPIWGLGHSLGSLAQVLISARHPVSRRRGQILLAYTRRGEEVVPVVRTAIAANPLLGPLVRAMDVQVASEFLSRGYEFVERALRGPAAQAGIDEASLQGVLPLVQQMLPLLRDAGREQAEFRPSASRLATAIREGYSERRTLLLRLEEDGLDEAPGLAAALAALPAARRCDLAVQVLPGQHLLPIIPERMEVGSVGGPLPALLRAGQSRGRIVAEQWEQADSQQEKVADEIARFVSESA